MKEIFTEKEQEDAKYHPLTSFVWMLGQCQKSMKKEPEDAKY
jgi:hypothetical protein